MPSAKLGKLTITKMTYQKKKVSVLFSDDVSMEITNDMALDHFLYVGKEVGVKERDTLKKESALSSCYERGLNMISRGNYTVHQMREKLKKCQFPAGDIEVSLRRLAERHLLDDERFCHDFVEYGEAKKWGHLRIIHELARLGIAEEIIKKIKFTVETEKANLDEVGNLLLKRYSKYNVNEKKSKILQALARSGYDYEMSKTFVAQNVLRDDEGELAALKREYDKAAAHYQKKYHGRELITHIVGRLRQKGYNYSDIKMIMEEVENVD